MSDAETAGRAALFLLQGLVASQAESGALDAPGFLESIRRMEDRPNVAPHEAAAIQLARISMESVLPRFLD